tara:strand:- start:2216 stop:2551 length:336 start_codon:yes stop_codon:yes gene_type:complete
MNNVYRCNVALDGDIGQVVVKEGVTVPELAVLRFIHLPTSITNICLMGKEKYDSKEERDRLGKIYSDEKVMEIFGQFGELPMQIKELNIDPALMEEGATPIGKFEKKSEED